MPGRRRKNPGRRSVVIAPIVNSPGLSERIGYLASQQRMAYNQSVEWLNRDPGLALMVSDNKGVPRRRSLCGRISDLLESKSTELHGLDSEKKAKWITPPKNGHNSTPRWVHDAGASLAHQAQQKFAADRQLRLAEIRRIEDKRHWWAKNPPKTPIQLSNLEKEERRYARLTRSHRRTLGFRTRKHGTQTLEVNNNQVFTVTPDRMSIWIGSKRKGGFRIPLPRPLPKDAEVRSLRLVEKRRGRMEIANRPLPAVEYEAHIAVEIAQTPAAPPPESLWDIVGVDVGVKKSWATSDGAFYDWKKESPHSCNCPAPSPQADGRRGRFRHQKRCRFARPQRLQARIIAKPGGSARRRASKRRKKLERQRRELLRMRAADRDRVFTANAQDLLDKRYSPVRMLAVETLRLKDMMATAKGGANAPGKKVRQKSGLNRSLADSAMRRGLAILGQEAAKRGIPVEGVNPVHSSNTCSKCGNVSSSSRKSQAEFECVSCGWPGNADTNAACVLRFRCYQQWVDPAAVLGLPFAGGLEKSSADYQIRLL